MNSACLFITYDGLLDPLGASQILPYLRGIAKHPRKVCILSFEKPERYRVSAEQLKKDLKEYGIEWQAIMFTSNWSYLGKACDFFKMYFYAASMIYKHQIKIIHARGHTPAQVGLFWRRFFSCRLLFDFRGLWVDEKIDKGAWNLNRRLDNCFYRYFKKKEKMLIQQADYMVVLTKAILPELKKLGRSNVEQVSVIPCCADFDHFQVSTLKEKNQRRLQLNIPSDALVIGYLGSVGKMYMMAEFFKVVENAYSQNPKTYVLILTPDISLARQEMQKYLSHEVSRQVVLKYAKRDEIPTYISVMDVMLSLIQPSYARLATSPTKIAESLACGVPVISNDGIGDVTQIINDLQIGGIVYDFSQEIDVAGMIQNMHADEIRNKARGVFDLKKADEAYLEAYKKLQRDPIC